MVFGKADWTGTHIKRGALDGTTASGVGLDKEDHSGTSVSSAGDVNGDGLDDLIIGAPDGGTNGGAYVVFGKADWTGTPAVDLGSLDGPTASASPAGLATSSGNRCGRPAT